MSRPFEYTEHTADIGFTAYGETLEELFSNAATALLEIMVPVETVCERRQREIAVRADALDELLVRWLNELLFLFETEGLLLRRHEIVFTAPASLESTAFGETLDLSRHRVKTGIKAVTYHRLSVRQENGRWVGHVVLDL